MKNQHRIYAKVNDWLDAEDEPSDAQLAEIEKEFQEWSKQEHNSAPLPWDWEMNLFDKGELPENPDEWYSDQETEEDEYPYDLY